MVSAADRSCSPGSRRGPIITAGLESARGQQNKEEEIACTDWLKYQVQRRRKHNLFIWKMTPVTWTPYTLLEFRGKQGNSPGEGPRVRRGSLLLLDPETILWANKWTAEEISCCIYEFRIPAPQISRSLRTQSLFLGAMSLGVPSKSPQGHMQGTGPSKTEWGCY